jgi:hypothetical protein
MDFMVIKIWRREYILFNFIAQFKIYEHISKFIKINSNQSSSHSSFYVCKSFITRFAHVPQEWSSSQLPPNFNSHAFLFDLQQIKSAERGNIVKNVVSQP